VSNIDEPLEPRSAIVVAAIVALGAGVASHAMAIRHQSYGDFLAWWFGARVLLERGDPYLVPPDIEPFFISEQLFYPLTALVPSVPFALLPYHIALATFMAIGSGVLAYGVARTKPHRLALFCSFPFVAALMLGHWSVYVAAALVLPAAGFLVAVKPNLGLATFVAKPSRPMLIGATILVALSLFAMPSWPARWLSVLADAPPHLIPMANWLGMPLALSALRWRRPEARLLFTMAILPQTATFADQLLLFFVAQSRRESVALALITVVGGIGWVVRLLAGGHPAIIGGPYVIASVYLPALVVLLRHPNVGELPPWLERRVGRLPSVLRGKPAAD
jgi:hypothetical protein